MKLRRLLSLTCIFLVGACASGPPDLPYPAFIQSEELPDMFLASLPGVRAKQFAGNPRTRRSSNLLDLPAGWDFSTGASPGKSVEIFVLKGQVTLGDMSLLPGGYAYMPPGSLGMQMSTQSGAQVLYFLDDADPAAMIQTPLITSGDLLDWRELSADPDDLGISEKVLRFDPGSGARTWLVQIDADSTQRWQSSTIVQEGYLISGAFQQSECVNGEVATWQYQPGGYFQRPAGFIHGGPEAGPAGQAIWLMRVPANGEIGYFEDCIVIDAN